MGKIRKILLLLFVSAVSQSFAQDSLEVVVSKSGASEDPMLYVESFRGPDEANNIFQTALDHCGWFRVSRSSEEVDYRLRAVWSGSQERGRLRVAVAAGGEPILDFVTQTPASPRDTVYKAVDILLNRLFDVPGIASSRIAFVGGQEGRKEIFTMNFDGSDIRQITHNNSISTEPSWGATGTERMFYTYYEATRMSIMTIAMEQGRQRRLARYRGLNAGACVSPENQFLAMSLSRDGAVDLYVMNLADQNLKRLTRSRAVASSPTWSPDGKLLCYVSDRNGLPHLFLVTFDGENAARLLNYSEEAVEPDWSWVSNQIIFSTKIGGSYAIGLIDMDKESGNKERRIVIQGGGDWQSPSWAPDGRHFVCIRKVGGRSQLMMVDVRSGEVTEISRPGNVELPVWSGLRAE